MSESYDVIVVGSGSTGGTLAARLSEDPSLRVLVLEAGQTFASADEMPAELLDPADITASLPVHPNNWALPGSLTEAFKLPVPRGKVMGGSSSINGAYFIRGTEADFATWVSLGNDQWGYDKVLPYYKRSETDFDFGGERHGKDGPIPVRREPADRAPAFTNAFTEACHGLGFAAEEDKNAGGSNGGVGPVPMNIADGRRVGSALAYLMPALSRPNLEVMGNALACRVLFDGARAVGVEAGVGNELRTFKGGTVVLSAGALRSPQLLMLSGVGPADHLREHGIEVLHDLPGVGAHLTDHPELSVAWRSEDKFPPMPGRGLVTTVLNWTAEESSHVGDLEIVPFVSNLGDVVKAQLMLRYPLETLKSLRHTSLRALMAQAKTARMPFALISLMQQDSRGTVRLRSASPLDTPDLSWNCFSDPDDRRRIGQAVRMAYDLFATAPMTRIGARLVNLERSDLQDQATLDAWIDSHIFTAGHCSCTCRMGPASDATAVVDQRGRVHGLEGLMVADTSIFPKLPSRGPNATAIMLGEKLADMFRGRSAGAVPTAESLTSAVGSEGQTIDAAADV